MKRIGFFSDVHSNLWAMIAMSEIVGSRQRGWGWYFGGDIVGWLYQPIECLEMLMKMIDNGLIRQPVAGNHDLMALDRFADQPEQIMRRVATAFSAGALSVKPKASQFLTNLPFLVDLPEKGCVVTHHSPFCLPPRQATAQQLVISSTCRQILSRSLPSGLSVDGRLFYPAMIMSRPYIEFKTGWKNQRWMMWQPSFLGKKNC